MRICESEEMYLETILLLCQKNGFVRRVDIAAEMGVLKPSVTSTMKTLLKKGYILRDESCGVQLTETGKSKAESVYERHLLITRLLLYIGADHNVAEENACRMEHVVSSALMDSIRNFIDNNPVYG